MLTRFWCLHCRFNNIINPETSRKPLRCQRCGCGVQIDAYYPGKFQLGKNTGWINQINKIAPSYKDGVNQRVDKRSSGAKLNWPDRTS